MNSEETIQNNINNQEEPKKVKVSKLSKMRRSKNSRLTVIIVLMIIVAALFIFWGKFRILLGALFVTLLLALGLEVSGNDWDLGKLWETKSFEQSKIERTENGTWLINDEKCQVNNLNCANFEYQEDAQELFEYCGGLTNDIHNLDGDNDGKVCEALPSMN